MPTYGRVFPAQAKGFAVSQYGNAAESAAAAGTTESGRPAFLITIDTEGDNLWSGLHSITTQNSHFLPRFQQLCEKYGFQPTWLTNWEMVECPVYREFAADALARGQAEIGMHLHAWNSPPVAPLTDDDFRRLPYLIQYSPMLMRRKIGTITDRLEDVFNTKMN